MSLDHHCACQCRKTTVTTRRIFYVYIINVIYLSSVSRFFQQSLPKFCSHCTKLRKILPNVGFANNYAIVMPKNNSYVIKVEKICPKRYLKILVAFITLQFLLMIRLYFVGLAVLLITLSTLLNKKHTFLPK